MQITCEECKNKFNKAPKDIKKTKHHFCSLQCYNISRKIKHMNLICEHCQKPFTRREKDARKANRFCSVSCSNKAYPRKSKTKKCKGCSNLVLRSYTYCPTCISQKKHWRITMTPDRPITDYIKTNDANRHNHIRQHARKMTKGRPQICVTCGYNKHVQTCHKKEIKEFPLTAMLGEVNHPDNLMLLCPNCHWEFDHPSS